MNGRLSSTFVNTAVAVRGLSPTTVQRGQHLVPDNSSPNLDEGLEVRIKDPLWFLSRQWQTGEFEAENGGKLAHLEVAWSTFPLMEVQFGEAEPRPIPTGTPLQPLVEAELDSAASPAWRAEALEYEFEAHAAAFEFAATDYDGSGLDWYHFDLDAAVASRPDGVRASRRAIPTNLTFPGMPHPRWWQFEDGDTYIDAFESSDPNPLSLILPEFLIADANNWFIVPIDQQVGVVREIERVRAVDSFGAVSEISPVSEIDGGWQMYTHSKLTPSSTSLGSSLLLVADLGAAPTEGDPVEQVVFVRDEDANLVWAVEALYWDHDQQRRVRPGPLDEPSQPLGSQGPGFRLRSPVPRHWIPYLPQPLDNAGQIYLRRARSREQFTVDSPQHRSQVVGEAWMLNEDEVPKQGVRVERLWRAVVDSKGERHFWIGRRKTLTARHPGSRLRYDFVE